MRALPVIDVDQSVCRARSRRATPSPPRNDPPTRLIVDPAARGLGLGKRLTHECIRFARKAGYRGVTLWTHSVLTAARHVYEQAGFTLTASEKRHTWGKDVVAEFWDLKF